MKREESPNGQDGPPAGPPKKRIKVGFSQNNQDRDDGKFVIAQLDRQQLRDHAAHLYAYTLMDHTAVAPHKTWIAWPMKDAPVPFEGQYTPRRALVEAMNSVLQRKVHQRIFKDKLEPVVDPEPELGHLGNNLVDSLETMLSNDKRAGLYTWKDIAASGKARQRLQRLFDPSRLREQYVDALGEPSDEVLALKNKPKKGRPPKKNSPAPASAASAVPSAAPASAAASTAATPSASASSNTPDRSRSPGSPNSDSD